MKAASGEHPIDASRAAWYNLNLTGSGLRSTPMLKSCSSVAAGLAFAAAVACPTFAAAQESKSGPLARQLTQLLDAAKLETIAAPDPAGGGFVAALYVPGTQLLVVSGKFQTPDIGVYRLERKEYRELYMDLMGGSVAGSRLVASDVSGDGFAAKPKRDVPPDSWERDAKTLAFEGSRKAKLSDELYDKAYNDADAEYARILGLLLTHAKVKGDLTQLPNSNLQNPDWKLEIGSWKFAAGGSLPAGEGVR